MLGLYVPYLRLMPRTLKTAVTSGGVRGPQEPRTQVRDVAQCEGLSFSVR